MSCRLPCPPSLWLPSSFESSQIMKDGCLQTSSMQATPRIVSGLPVSSRVNENSTSINKILFEIHLMELGPTHIVTRFDKQDLNNVTMIIMMKLISWKQRKLPDPRLLPRLFEVTPHVLSFAFSCGLHRSSRH